MLDRRLALQARTDLRWWLVTLAALQAGLLVAMRDWRLELRDPEYGRKLASLQARLAERPGARPLVVVIGSSRVAVGLRPELLPACDPEGRSRPLVFNFALCGAGPLMELVCLRRLLAEGVRPDWVFVEVWPPLMEESNAEQTERVDALRLNWHDVHLLARYHPHRRRLYRAWCQQQFLPWSTYNFLLLTEYAPSWLPEEWRVDMNWRGLDGWGWLRVPRYERIDDWDAWRLRGAFIRQNYSRHFGAFQPSEASDRALRELLALCHRAGIRAALLLMPDTFLNGYTPLARAGLETYLSGLGGAERLPVIDARTWVSPTGFYEGVHLVHAGAATFTQELDRRVLQPLQRDQALPLLTGGMPGETASPGRSLPEEPVPGAE